MPRIRRNLTFANVMACAAVFIALGGVAYAAATISGKNIINHSITGKDIKKASIPLTALKNIPEGKAGPAGPAGAPGSALAYAHVNADGTLDSANSRNIASTKLTAQPGYYCVLPSVAVHNVIADGDGGLTGRIVNTSFEDHVTSCPDGAASVETFKFNTNKFEFVDSSFYIVFN
jgi:hypothetical protein